MRWLFALLVVAAGGAALAKLALGPLYPRYTEAECQDAYGRARTLADTNRVDLHPYDAARRAVNHRCGELRGTRAQGAARPTFVSLPGSR